MAFHVRDPDTDRVVRELAATRGTSITEAIRAACEAALEKAGHAATESDRRARMKAVRDRLARHPQDESVVIDKAFFDALNDE